MFHINISIITSTIDQQNQMVLAATDALQIQYLDWLDCLGLPVQQELLCGVADYILAKNQTPDPDNPEEQPSQVGSHWIARFL